MSKTGKMFKTKPKTKAKPTTSNTSDQVKKKHSFCAIVSQLNGFAEFIRIKSKEKKFQTIRRMFGFRRFSFKFEHQNFNGIVLN